jgi:hypothetical protein
MRHVAVVVVVALGCVAAACGPGSTNADDDASGDDAGGGDDDDDQPPPPPPPTGSVTGTVWAPGHAPGMVPDGYEMPISGALVYVAGESPPAIPDEVYCDRCELRPAVYATTDAKGKFELTGVPSGEHLVVVEKAQFRLETTIDVPVDTGLALTDAQTTLPSEHDPAHGKWIPRVAIAIGDSDQIEDIFAKMGILGLDSDGRVEESSFDDTDRVELWGNPIDPPFPTRHQGTISQLFGDLAKMKIG